MSFRITQQTLMRQAVQNANYRNQQIGKLQDQVASGLRVTKPSDDPLIISTLSARKAADARMDADLANISEARLKLRQSETHLNDALNIFVRAKEIALGAAQSQERETLAQQVDALLDGLLAIANAKDGGIQLFAGTSSYEPAFEVRETDESGRPVVVAYTGSERRSQVSIGPGAPVDTLYSGNEIFGQSNRQGTAFIGNTGARAGVGTDTARLNGQLIVRHTGTAYGAAGVAPGASSSGGDTIIGAHVLTIENNPELGRVARLNDGAPVAFDGASTDLRLFGRGGESVYVDLSAVPGGFTGQVPITATGTLSVDGGLTETPIDFSSNQLLVHSESGDVTNVDSSGIRRAGTDQIEYVGTGNAIQSLMQLRNLLRGADEMSSSQLNQMLDYRIGDIQRVHDQLLQVLGEQAVNLENLDQLEYRTEELQLETRTAIGDMENADMAETILQLQNEQNLLQFIYASAAGIYNNSLLDFIR